MEENSEKKKNADELECSIENYREKYDEKCREVIELENRNRTLDKAISDLTKIIKDQNKELSDLRIINKLEKDREIAKKLRPNSRGRSKKFVCTFDGCDYFTDVQEDFDFHNNVHKMATVSYASFYYLLFIL